MTKRPSSTPSARERQYFGAKRRTGVESLQIECNCYREPLATNLN
ncbi:hypothetical protein X961_5671 [Burkholderia pseudomallei MSHR5613]|nr:hypothetical protein X961_5671 [Burkholderia pseudomallei MSHR5613]